METESTYNNLQEALLCTVMNDNRIRINLDQSNYMIEVVKDNPLKTDSDIFNWLARNLFHGLENEQIFPPLKITDWMVYNKIMQRSKCLA